MPRTFGRLLCSIWDDPDFLALTSDAKVLYTAFSSQQDTSPAGVLPLTPRRWRKWLGDDVARTEAALDELTRTRFVLVDDDTAEVCVRTFIKHDGRLDNPKMVTSIHNSIAGIRSAAIREACYRLLCNLTGKPPGRTAIEPGSNGDRSEPEPLAAKHPASKHPAAAAAASTDGFNNAPLPPAAAAAIDLLIKHKLTTSAVRNANGLRRKLTTALPAEHATTLLDHLERHPDATARELASDVLGLTELDLHRIGTTA